VKKFEQAVAFLTFVTGLLLFRQGLNDLATSRQIQARGDGMAIVLAGPPGTQKAAQAQFLKDRYGLRVISVAELKSHNKIKGGTPFLIADYPAGAGQADYLAALDGRRDLPKPVFIEIANLHLSKSPLDVDLIQSLYPDADIWTFDSTRPPAHISATLQALLDPPARPHGSEP